ncbi:MAG: hypothetical protein Q7R81_06515 [Candidatus Peregrinibacteria bacterium]|nr:hypothetical protein [Candidatus Peregrinibacteria bacterium]
MKCFRPLLCALSLLVLVGCGSDSDETATFSLKDAGFSIDYPKNWYVEDAHFAGFVSFLPKKPEAAETVDSLMVYIADRHHYSAEEVAEGHEREDGGCDDPLTYRTGATDVLEMQCWSGNDYLILEGEGDVFSVVFNRKSAHAGEFKRMSASARVQ